MTSEVDEEEIEEKAKCIKSVYGYGYGGRFDISTWEYRGNFFVTAPEYDRSPILALRNEAEDRLEGIAQANPYDKDLDY